VEVFDTASTIDSLQRERNRKKVGVIVRDTTFGGGQETICPVWKVPRQCPLVLLVWATCIIGIIFFNLTLEGQLYSKV
jgi:hypothetical protein